MNERCHKERTENSRDDWETPQDLFNLIEKRLHITFTLDAAADDSNHKCERYFTKKLNGLLQNWQGETVYLNPPYNEKPPWLKKAYQEGIKKNTIVVVLIPAATDTGWWHRWCMKANRIYFLKGRVDFLIDGVPKKNNNMGSALIIFERKLQAGEYPQIRSFYHKEKDRIAQDCDITQWV